MFKINFIQKILESIIGDQVINENIDENVSNNTEESDFEKIKKILDSVENRQQLKVAIKSVNNFILLHRIKETSPKYKYLLKIVGIKKLKYGSKLKRSRKDLGGEDNEISERMRHIIKKILKEEVEDDGFDWIREIPGTEWYGQEYRFFDVNECDEHNEYGECIGDSGSYFIKIPEYEASEIWDLDIDDVGGPGDEGLGVIEWMVERGLLEHNGDGIEYVMEIDRDEYCRAYGKYSDKDFCENKVIDEDSYWGDDEDGWGKDDNWSNDKNWGSTGGGTSSDTGE